MGETANLDRDGESGIITSITLATSDCLKDMSTAEEENKLDNLRLSWMRRRHIFYLDAMARHCENIDVEYEVSEVLFANGKLPNDDGAKRFADIMILIEGLNRP